MPPRAVLSDSGIVISDPSKPNESIKPDGGLSKQELKTSEAAKKDDQLFLPVNPPSLTRLLAHAASIPAVYLALDRWILPLPTTASGSLLGHMTATSQSRHLTVILGTSVSTYFGIHAVLKKYLCSKEYYQKMSDEERRRMEGWSLSSVNAVLMTVTGFQSHFDPNTSRDLNALATFAAYLLVDLPILLPYYKFRALDLLHHSVSLVLCHGMLYSDVLKTRRAFVMLTEVSTIFLDLARILPVIGWGKTKTFMVSAVLFALSFLGVRVGWYGALLYRAEYLKVDDDWLSLGKIGRWAARALFGLQCWWVGEIVAKAGEILGKKK